MKKSLLLLAAAGTLAACAGSKKPADEQIGMANPASVFCEQQGGRLEPKKDAQGNEYALCHLPDGRVIEEWEFFRSQQK
ncbi:putative hemolysin [Neisseria sp. HSC-16F19]|nr:DUF333 domain-containing protein [Neisseria sp. HSC-16F19]MCP2039884.1 putative hemolysin [Neisseria sp. HSC-16F19]